MNKCSCKQNCSCKTGCNCNNCRCNKYASYLDVLANPNRIRIIESLSDKPKNVSEIIKDTGIEQTYVSHSLKKLEEKKIVLSSRDGKFKIYSLNRNMTDPIFLLLEHNFGTPTVSSDGKSMKKSTKKSVTQRTKQQSTK